MARLLRRAVLVDVVVAAGLVPRDEDFGSWSCSGSVVSLLGSGPSRFPAGATVVRRPGRGPRFFVSGIGWSYRSDPRSPTAPRMSTICAAQEKQFSRVLPPSLATQDTDRLALRSSCKGQWAMKWSALSCRGRAPAASNASWTRSKEERARVRRIGGGHR